MAGIFRFSNAVSDIGKFINTYKKLYHHFVAYTEEDKFFNHDDAARYLALNGLATSLGAVGEEALNRSTRDDKSRDPLYNQHKSYSEMFRMLGWYETGDMQTNFRIPEYGAYVAETESEDVLKKLFSLNVLHIVSPNPLTTVKGGNILRPFATILKLMLLLDNVIFRDEIILGVLACEDDTDVASLQSIARQIRATRRQGYDFLENEFQQLMANNGINSSDTLRNYTRFPISALKWTGWTEPTTLDTYGKKLKFLKLTPVGKQLAISLNAIPDIRLNDIQSYDIEEQASFVALSNLQKLGAVGFDLDEYLSCIEILKQKCENIIRDKNIDNDGYLFFGYQESPRSLLQLSDSILENLL